MFSWINKIRLKVGDLLREIDDQDKNNKAIIRLTTLADGPNIKPAGPDPFPNPNTVFEFIAKENDRGKLAAIFVDVSRTFSFLGYSSSLRFMEVVPESWPAAITQLVMVRSEALLSGPTIILTMYLDPDRIRVVCERISSRDYLMQQEFDFLRRSFKSLCGRSKEKWILEYLHEPK